MSIFIAIPTLIDPEIINTVRSAVDNADNKHSINIGVACMANKEFSEYVISSLKNISNVVVDAYNFDKSINGVGHGRLLAMKRYNAEDNFLQIDSHTLFEKGWDSNLNNLWNECIENTQNNKTVMSAYLPKYKRIGSEVFIDGKDSRYPVFTHNHPSFPNNMIGWTDADISLFKQTINKKFIPLIKISGGFIFSNIYFVENCGINYNIKFFDEEMIQTIELLYNNFALAFPNTELPLHHLYYDDIEKGYERQATSFTIEDIGDEWQKYIDNKDNFNKCILWGEYAKANVFDGSFKEWHIPQGYRIKNDSL